MLLARKWCQSFSSWGGGGGGGGKEKEKEISIFPPFFLPLLSTDLFLLVLLLLLLVSGQERKDNGALVTSPLLHPPPSPSPWEERREKRETSEREGEKTAFCLLEHGGLGTGSDLSIPFSSASFLFIATKRQHEKRGTEREKLCFFHLFFLWNACLLLLHALPIFTTSPLLSLADFCSSHCEKLLFFLAIHSLRLPPWRRRMERRKGRKEFFMWQMNHSSSPEKTKDRRREDAFQTAYGKWSRASLSRKERQREDTQPSKVACQIEALYTL